MTRQIITLGGGGFSMEPDNLALDRYIVRQAGRPRPRVCFVPTASADSADYIVRFYAAFAEIDCRPAHLSLFKLPTADLEGFVMDQDVIYVGGGNTKSMLGLWREWGLDTILRAAYERGVVLAGLSAGANCWFEQCSTDAWPGELRPLPCLGLLSGSFCPHFDGEPDRRPNLHRLLRTGAIGPGYAAEDSAGLHFVDGALAQAICSRPSARVYRVDVSGGDIVETALAMTLVD